jgi:hypothetical protein
MSGKRRRSVENREFNASEMMVLLLSLVFMLLCAPLLDAYAIREWFRPVGLTLVVLAVVWAVRRRRSHARFAISLMVILLPICWTTLFLDNRWLFAFGSLLAAAFFSATALIILRRVLREYTATFDAIWGAICVYLLLGLSWAMLYWSLASLDETCLTLPSPVTAALGEDWRPPLELSHVVYFSFVTMSTLGYGDIVPRTPLIQSACWMQAVVGQLFIAVLVARLVGTLPRDGHG